MRRPPGRRTALQTIHRGLLPLAVRSFGAAPQDTLRRGPWKAVAHCVLGPTPTSRRRLRGVGGARRGLAPRLGGRKRRTAVHAPFSPEAARAPIPLRRHGAPNDGAPRIVVPRAPRRVP